MYNYKPYESNILKFNRTQAIKDLKRYNDLYIIDTETTGLTKTSEITEIALVHYPSKEVLIDTLIRPIRLEDFKDSKASEISHITVEMLEDAPLFIEVWDDIKKLLAEKRIAAYNAQFDTSMILRSCFANRLTPVPFSSLCIMKLFSSFTNTNDNWKLSEALAIMGLPEDENGIAHTALTDTLNTCSLLDALKAQEI